ncbi:BQ5605_C003g02040 [Microbotryum silenes-dioicae]|uniref:BQ5605_C003g02040 protein n=1 Tax=Microbotryum silenes-dioicae TaxID=796604 RepID=A0A2X0P356_9BASI|nr:BQ5605_C003g02040 [Microbotryum silenes-dioicae]
MLLTVRYALEGWTKFAESQPRSSPNNFLSPQTLDGIYRVVEGYIALVRNYRNYWPQEAFIPWRHGTEMVEHFFGTLRKIVKEFDALDFLQSRYYSVRCINLAAGSAQGYHHIYQNLHNLNLTALGTYPGDGDIEAIAVKAALAASDTLKGLRMWDIIEERDIEKRKQAPLPDILVDDEATSTVRQGVPPNVDEAGLNQVLDRLRLVGSEPLPCILRREERDAILSALLSVTALDIDQEALIDAVDAGFDQADAEEEDRQLQTILAEACHEHEQSKGALYSVPTLDLDSLLAQRRAHQCRHLEKIKFKGGAQNVASDQPFAQDRTEHRGNVHSAALRRIVETMGMDRYRQFVGNEGNLRFSNSGANIREKTLHEQATTAIITEGRSHDKMKGRQEVYGQIMSNHVLVRAVDGDVSALRPLKVDTLVVYGIPEEPMGLPSGEQCRERLAIGIGMPNYYLLRNIYKKSSTTYESVESVDSLALVANAVIQELRVIAPGVYSNLSYRGNARIRQVDGRCIINSLEPDLSSINYEVKDSTRSNWRDEREIHITVNQEKRYRLLQNIKGIRTASLACLAPGGRSQTKTKRVNNDEE